MRHPHRLAVASAFVLVVTLLLAVPASGQDHAGPTATPSMLLAPDDFSSSFRGYWWDFNSKDHMAWVDSLEGWDNPRLVAGQFVGTTLPKPGKAHATDAQIRLSPLSLPNAIPTAQEHQDTRLDPAYDILRVSMCSKVPTVATVLWHRDASFADGDYGGTRGVDIAKGCRIYKFDLNRDRNPNVGTLPWSAGGYQSIRIRPAADPGVKVRIDWATLTPEPRSDVVTIDFTPGQGLTNLYLSPLPSGRRKILIAANLEGSSYDWATTNLAPGTYWLVQKTDGVKTVGGTITVDAPPQGKVTSPSPYSGEDYASTVVGDAWNMSNRADVIRTRNLAEETFSRGQFHGVNVDGSADPGVVLNVTQPIDPHEYHYLTYRMRIEDSAMAGDGAVVRLLWWIADDVHTTSQDIRDFDGWQIVSVDLLDVELEPNAQNLAGPWGDAPITQIRLDPHESTDPKQFSIDWVKLTKMDEADQRYVVRWDAWDPDGDSVAASVFYGASSDERIPVDCDAASKPGTCIWNTNSVPGGEWWVSIELTDAAGQSTWIHADAPLRIAH